MALRDTVLSFLSSKGGTSTYREIWEPLEYRERQELPRVLKQLRKEGVVDQVIDTETGEPVHKVWLVEGGS